VKQPRHFLVVVCHPVPDSFVRAAADRTIAALQRSGHSVEVLDLDRLQFDPVLSRDEWLDRHNGVPASLDQHVAGLRRATDLVLVYPTWYGGLPAMLKGWFDRVWGRGVAWDLRLGAGRTVGLLRNITRLWVVTTHGSSKLVNMGQGEGGLRFVHRSIRLSTSPLIRTRWVAMYGNDSATTEQRTAFLQRVEKVFSGIA
jgi:NAD(P)H dehydrogenase (quinone)